MTAIPNTTLLVVNVSSGSYLCAAGSSSQTPITTINPPTNPNSAPYTSGCTPSPELLLASTIHPNPPPSTSLNPLAVATPKAFHR
eukprot:CAMPEP_0171308040 /NCGR_PEP_ID=MMETSP0816-20121228/18146_1 /TAXON_ID=420281 /ORGANISM="Proboscia inermis, Strain CCAP1064/1" /LENGTH=84 /DNA_ID=CAMNT_0011790661 /DNA_START=25 /DNA_END=275 /DNA_ORIENTATION=+